jgi:Winged helix DNA-binding domain
VGEPKTFEASAAIRFLHRKVDHQPALRDAKTYDLMDRHFSWESSPRGASERQTTDYLLARDLRSRGLISLDSIRHLSAKRKPLVLAAIDAKVKRGLLVQVAIAGAENTNTG